MPGWKEATCRTGEYPGECKCQEGLRLVQIRNDTHHHADIGRCANSGDSVSTSCLVCKDLMAEEAIPHFGIKELSGDGGSCGD